MKITNISLSPGPKPAKPQVPPPREPGTTLRLGRILFLIGALFLIGLLLCTARAFQFRGELPALLISQTEKHLRASLSFQDVKMVLVPFPALQLNQPHLESMEGAFTPWTAEEVRLNLRLLPLLWGKVEFSGFRLRGGEGRLWKIPLHRVELKINGLGYGKSASFKGRALTPQGKEILRAQGKFVSGRPGENFWKDLGLKGELALSGFSLYQGLDPEIHRQIPRSFGQSEWKGQLRFNKEKGAPTVSGSTQFEVQNLSAPNTPNFSLTGESALAWNLATNFFEFKQLSVKSPFGELTGYGIWNTDTREIKEARFVGRKVILESVLRSFPDLNRVLPLDTGVSGEGEFDFALQGSWDYLSLHANWNLTSAVLTYGNVFSKPKDFPMVINFDFLLKGGSELSGDISTRVSNTTVKGALVSLDLQKGTGEMTLITNKFDLKNWAPLLRPLASYAVSGEAKVLLSAKGNLIHFSEAQKMFNLTLDKVSLLTADGHGLKEVSGQIDFSPLNFRIRDLVLKLGETSLQAQAEIFNFFENAQGHFEILSPQVEMESLLKNLESIHLMSHFQTAFPYWPQVQTELRRFLPASVPLEEFSLKAEVAPHKLTLKEMEFRVFAGGVRLGAEIDRSGESPRFSLQVQLDQINLSRYFEAQRTKELWLDGNLFLSGHLNAEGWEPGGFSKALTGAGALSVTNGEWHAIDLIAPVRNLAPFAPVLSGSSQTTPFHDLKAEWKYRDGRFETEDILIHTPDYWIEGKGNLTLEGMLNSRFDVYLSEGLTQKLLDSWKADEMASNRLLGPIPMLVVGPLKKPELKIDDRSFERFLESLRARRFRRLLRQPFQN